MPSTITMVCLADSHKIGGHCIAGKIVEGKDKGKWIRPISNRAECALTDRDISYKNGRLPNLLDIITIEIKERVPANHHRENCAIDETAYWKKEGEFKLSQLSKLCDEVSALWVDGHHSRYGMNDKVPTEIVYEKIRSSLLLVQPQNVSYSVGTEYSKKKVRADFKFNKNSYTIAVTDNRAEKLYLGKKQGTYNSTESDCFFCVSLAENFNGYCYKLIAGIIQ
jgi:hypothetical protein